MISKTICMGMVAILMSYRPALATIDYLSESRSVQANGTVWPVTSDMQSQNDTKQSNDPGSFDQTAKVQLSVEENIPSYAGTSIPNGLTSYALATQNSSFDQSGISESGCLDYYTTQTYEGNGSASAASSLVITFALDGEYNFTLGFMGGVMGETATLADLTSGQTWDYSTTFGQGVLMPGEYILTHDLSYGPVYHDESRPINFGLAMSFSPLEAALPEPGGLLLGVSGIFMAFRRRAKSGSGHCR